ncbi:MAG: alpha/beta hydrolase [Oscillospiraceae bacterium]|jgi:acetyl esterase/lipase|nr:alpha/beta hydrolase [Oscillospiraceae bacterium]
MPYVKFLPVDSAAGGFAMPLIDASNITRKWLDVDYTPAKPHPSRKLDIYLPETGDGPFPAIIAIHGGAFWGGAKNDMQVAAYFDFIPEGFALVSVEQRLCAQLPGGGYDPDGLFPNPVFDFRAAIRFCRANAAKYKLDPAKFVTAGGSAGGYHSILGAVQPNNPALYDASLGWADVDGSVQAVLDWFGVGDLVLQSKFTDETPGMKLPDGTEFKMDNYADIFLGVNARENENLAYFAGPDAWIDKDVPPVLLQHGVADEIVPVECSRKLAETIASAAGADRVILEEFEGYTHGDTRFNSGDNIARCVAWVREKLGI